MIRAGGAALLLLAGLGLVPGAAAQTAGSLAFACRSVGGDANACAATAYAAQALEGHIALAAGFGSDVAGTASNLGQRLGTAPRVALQARYGWVRTSLPDLAAPGGLQEVTFTVPTVHVGAAVGLFDGFRLLPTVGGFLAVDVIGSMGLVRLPDDSFSDDVTTYTLGARIGIFRESFTLPGVSIAVSRRFLEDAFFGATTGGGTATLSVDPGVTSLRATVGKDLFAVELLAGFGWDEVSAVTSFSVTDGVTGVVAGSGPIDVTRRHYFVSAAKTFGLVLSVSVEAGYATGFGAIPGYVGAFDPSSTTIFGSAAFRFTI